MAAALELMGLYHQRERGRQPDRIGDIEPRATRGDVSHHAVDAAAAAEGERAVLEHSMSGRCPLLDHRRKSEFPFIVLTIAKGNYGQLNRISPVFESTFRFRLRQ